MTTSLQSGWPGARAWLAILIAAGGGPVCAASPSAHRYSIVGELQTGTTVTVDDRPSVAAQLTLLPTPDTPSGSGFSLSSTLESFPLVCATDLIFRDGFDVLE